MRFSVIGAGVSLEPEKWYLFTITRCYRMEGKSPAVIAQLECAKGPAIGQKLGERFALSEKAISRFEVMTHRAGVEQPIKTVDCLDAKLWGELCGRKVWARLRMNSWGGQEVLGVDGWNFRAEDDPPEEAAEPVDYAAQDAWDVAMDGL